MILVPELCCPDRLIELHPCPPFVCPRGHEFELNCATCAKDKEEAKAEKNQVKRFSVARLPKPRAKHLGPRAEPSFPRETFRTKWKRRLEQMKVEAEAKQPYVKPTLRSEPV